ESEPFFYFDKIIPVITLSSHSRRVRDRYDLICLNQNSADKTWKHGQGESGSVGELNKARAGLVIVEQDMPITVGFKDVARTLGGNSGNWCAQDSEFRPCLERGFSAHFGCDPPRQRTANLESGSSSAVPAAHCAA